MVDLFRIEKVRPLKISDLRIEKDISFPDFSLESPLRPAEHFRNRSSKMRNVQGDVRWRVRRVRVFQMSDYASLTTQVFVEKYRAEC